MNYTYTWRITNLEAIREQDSLTNVVATAWWILEGRDENGKYARHWGVQQLNTDNINPDTFTTYENLTEAQVITWVENTLINQESDFGLSGEYENVVEMMKSKLRAIIEEEDVYRNTGIPW